MTAAAQQHVCDPQLCPSYLHAEGLLIDKRTWASVAAYVQAGGGLFAGMLHKISQNLHLQPLLPVQVHFQRHRPASPLTQCFEWLHGEFTPRTAPAVFGLVQCLATCNAQVQTSTLRFFQRSQPFCGASKGSSLAHMFCQKLVLGCSYADDVEQAIKAFSPEPSDRPQSQPQQPAGHPR
jgi:hypothetical protein